MLNEKHWERISAEMDALAPGNLDFVVQCRNIKLCADGIEITLKEPKYESLQSIAKRIVIKGCEYVLKKKKGKKE